jgi:hypothetical protein
VARERKEIGYALRFCSPGRVIFKLATPLAFSLWFLQLQKSYTEWKIALINIITGTTDFNGNFFLSKHVLINPGRRCVVLSAAFFGVKMNDVNA